jgi:hypothetical protein
MHFECRFQCRQPFGHAPAGKRAAYGIEPISVYPTRCGGASRVGTARSRTPMATGLSCFSVQMGRCSELDFTGRHAAGQDCRSQCWNRLSCLAYGQWTSFLRVRRSGLTTALTVEIIAYGITPHKSALGGIFGISSQQSFAFAGMQDQAWQHAGSHSVFQQ